jgi:hypothetical protein
MVEIRTSEIITATTYRKLLDSVGYEKSEESIDKRKIEKKDHN